MTPNLRKRHQLIWWILPIVLCLFWGLSYSVSNPIQSSKNVSVGEEDLTITIKKNKSGQQVVNILARRVSNAQTAIYIATNEEADIEQAQLLGIINKPGNHSFLLNSSFANEPSKTCLLYTSPSPRDATLSRMPSSA